MCQVLEFGAAVACLDCSSNSVALLFAARNSSSPSARCESVTGMTSTCHRDYSHIICISTIHHLLSSASSHCITTHHLSSYHIIHMSSHVIPHPMSKLINTSNMVSYNILSYKRSTEISPHTAGSRPQWHMSHMKIKCVLKLACQ